MCRIAGIINHSLSFLEIRDIVANMCDCMEHGGPDDHGLYLNAEANLVLGNRRLALVDLSAAGHQPMHYQNRYTITYNGEIFNYKPLRKELEELGHNFDSHTDTEVILAAFSQWNFQSFEKLNGMFAFALWDNQEKELFLVRDAVGIKPLYYSYSNNGIAFASETKALSLVPFLRQENVNWPVYLLAYGHIPEPVTTISSVLPLQKGCFIKYQSISGKSSLQLFKHNSYWEPVIKSADNPLFKKIMQESVDRHLVADASIGVFLSGGLDSSVIASLAARSKKSKVNTLSLYFDEKPYSEKKYQDILLKQINSSSYQYLLKEEEFHNCFEDIIQDMDMPCSDGINVWFISNIARKQGLKAVLSGIGADELFGGYPSFSRFQFSRLLQLLPDFVINTKKKSRKKQLNRLSYLTMGGIKGIYLFLRGHFTPIEIARQLDAKESEVWEILNSFPVMNDVSNLSYKNQASWMEFNLYMQNQLLRDADVMGMAHGVEIRVPFLDDEVISFANHIDPELKYCGPLPKQFLINNFTDILPREIWDRPKMGFSFPFAEWLGNSSYVNDLMQNAKDATVNNYGKFLEGKLHWSHLMCMILLKEKGII